jgi:thiol:disulfide interchange protein
MKAKKKPNQEQHASVRLIVGFVVGVVIVVVVGIKMVTGQQSAAAIAATPAPPVATAPTKVPSPSAQAAITMGPELPTPTQDSAGNDPFPANPAAQVQWVARNKRPAMILYHSTNCIPCKAMDQLVKKVHADYEPAVVFIDVITNDQANSVEVRRAGIQFIPTTFFVSSSGQSKKVVGAMKEEALRAELASLQAGN